MNSSVFKYDELIVARDVDRKISQVQFGHEQRLSFPARVYCVVIAAIQRLFICYFQKFLQLTAIFTSEIKHDLVKS